MTVDIDEQIKRHGDNERERMRLVKIAKKIRIEMKIFDNIELLQNNYDANISELNNITEEDKHIVANINRLKQELSAIGASIRGKPRGLMSEENKTVKEKEFATYMSEHSKLVYKSNKKKSEIIVIEHQLANYKDIYERGSREINGGSKNINKKEDVEYYKQKIDKYIKKIKYLNIF
jgi:hypothetical protein